MWAFSGIVILLYIGIAYVRMHANGVSFSYAFVTQSYILMGSLYLLSMILELVFVLFLPLFAQKLHDKITEKVRDEIFFGIPFFYGFIAVDCMSSLRLLATICVAAYRSQYPFAFAVFNYAVLAAEKGAFGNLIVEIMILYTFYKYLTQKSNQ